VPVEVTLAEIIQEGRRTIDKWAPNVSDPIRDVTGVPIRVGTLRRLLAVARAAVEMVEAENDFRAFYGFTGADTARVIERRFAAFAALDAAVRGEKGGEK